MLCMIGLTSERAHVSFLMMSLESAEMMESRRGRHHRGERYEATASREVAIAAKTRCELLVDAVYDWFDV